MVELPYEVQACTWGGSLGSRTRTDVKRRRSANAAIGNNTLLLELVHGSRGRQDGAKGQVMGAYVA